jgi:hypothetical protein
MLIGLVLGLGAGVGAASLQEATDRSARRAEHLTAAFPYPVLAEVPEIMTLEDLRKKSDRGKTIVVTAVISLVALVLVFHFFVMDLDVFWARVFRKLPL